jgi:lipid-A-disaccharide synthase
MSDAAPVTTRASTLKPRPPRIALVAGEASGDQLGAGLVEALRRQFPDAQFGGIGGPRMVAAGLDAWHPAEALSVMGLAEVLRHLPRLLSLRRALVRRLLAWRPDVFVGIDAPDFNLGVERTLKRAGIRTVHYVSPSVWAWRERRAARLGDSADRVLCLFPMEPAIYARYGVDARYVGHPLADRMALEPDRHAARAALGLTGGAPVVAVLPGSRLGEVGRLAGDLLRAAALVIEQRPEWRIVVPAANAGCRALVEREVQVLGLADRVRVVDGHAQDAMVASELVLLASGTAALEALLAKRPMVVTYRLSWLTYWLVRAFGLLKVARCSLPNILVGEPVVPELTQHEATPQNIAAAALAWLDDPRRGAELLPRFRAVHETLRRGADQQAADAVAELLVERAGASA